jgi:hypothetical protein
VQNENCGRLGREERGAGLPGGVLIVGAFRDSESYGRFSRRGFGPRRRNDGGVAARVTGIDFYGLRGVVQEEDLPATFFTLSRAKRVCCAEQREARVKTSAPSTQHEQAKEGPCSPYLSRDSTLLRPMKT